ncbi:MAG: hypothetical protein ACREMJ_12770 [Gemmatimonadales bacterium]
MKRLVHCLAVVALVAACDQPMSGSGAPPVVLGGAWEYDAVQTSPVAAVLTGTLDVTGQQGADFEGTLEATETEGQGGVRQLAGPVSGRALDAATVDFDAYFGLSGRRHLGTVTADTIRGAWVEIAGAEASSGSFVAVRRTQP